MHRMIVLIEIEADPDDTQTLIRLLLYWENIDILGLIATTSTHMRDAVHQDSIPAVIRAHAKGFDTLLKHDANCQKPEIFEALVKKGAYDKGRIPWAKRCDWPAFKADKEFKNAAETQSSRRVRFRQSQTAGVLLSVRGANNNRDVRSLPDGMGSRPTPQL